MINPPRRLGSASIRVFLIDDDDMVRRGLSDLIRSAGGMVLVGEAGTAEEALRRIRTAAPDVVLLAQQRLGENIDACRQIRSRHPGVSCLFLASYDDHETLHAAEMAGAAGVILRQVRGFDLIDRIRSVAQGQSPLNPAVTLKLLSPSH